MYFKIFQSMWASDSSIALAMSRLQLQTPQQLHHLFSQKTVNNSNNNHHHHNHSHSHSHGHHKHVGCRHAHHCHNHDTNNNNNNNKNLLSSLQQPRIVVPHPSQLPPVQLKSLPSTPLATKHISTSSYADYENYLFI